LKFAPAGVFMLLHEEDDICTIPENDTLGAVTQLITRYLTGQVGAYMEFYDFTEKGMLIGVPDYVPTEIVDGPVMVMPTAFGKFGEGLLNVSKVKTGPITLARLSNAGDRYTMHVATGEAVAPRKWEEAGWPSPAPHLPSLEIILDQPVDTFLDNVLSQHYIIAYGNHTDVLNDLCHILGVEMVSSHTANGVGRNGHERREELLSGNHWKHKEVVFFDPASIKHL
jgi:L-fucose isomerase-like protein